MNLGPSSTYEFIACMCVHPRPQASGPGSICHCMPKKSLKRVRTIRCLNSSYFFTWNFFAWNFFLLGICLRIYPIDLSCSARESLHSVGENMASITLSIFISLWVT